MQDIPFIVHEDVPRWYSLGWKPAKKSISIFVHRDFLKRAKPVEESAPITTVFMKKFGFGSFEGSLERNFGFDGALSRSENGEWVEFRAKLPKVFQTLDKKCPSCHGRKRDSLLKRSCLYCEGSGKERIYVWKPAFAVSASLNILLELLAMYHENRTRSEKPQLMTVNLFTDTHLHGGSLSGDYSVPLVRWLSAHVHQSIPEMASAMGAVYQHMLGRRRDKYFFDRFSARVDYEGGWLNVTCPGDACGLNPDHGAVRGDGRGYSFSCHNVDNPAQQMTLLAGLAALHEVVDKSLSS